MEQITETNITQATQTPQPPKTPEIPITINNVTNDLSNGAQTPVTAFVITLLFVSINLIILAVSISKNKNPQNPRYIINELFKQSTLLYVISQVFTLTSSRDIFNVFQNYETVIIPTTFIIVTYILNITMRYAVLGNCQKPNRKLIYFLSIIPSFVVGLSYFAVVSFDWMKNPFYELLGGGVTSWGRFMAIGFWAAAFIFPTVSFIYFTLLKFSCSDAKELTIKDYRTKKEQKKDN